MNFRFKNYLQSVENFLASFYRFEKLASVENHLLTSSDLNQFSENETKLGSTFFVEEQDEIWAGVYFNSDLIQRILEQSPFQKLNQENLNDFLVLTEEVSHFHFVLNRYDRQIPVSKTEIEMQGEIDKWLVSSHLLNHQSGKDHARVVFELLFNATKIVSADSEVYERASKLAFHAIKDIKDHKIQDMQEVLRELYFACGQDKFSYFAKVG